MHEVIFEADTPKGKLFDVILLIAILLSVGVVMLESVPEISLEYGRQLRVAEYVFTILFTIEYVLRLISVKQTRTYVLSFYGIVDLLSILPTFVELLLPGVGSIRVIRIFRLLRVLRVLKLVGFLKKEDHGFYGYSNGAGDDHGYDGLLGGGFGGGLYEYTEEYLLGNCNSYNGGIW